MHDLDDVRPVHLQIACLHLRHKLMYVDERQSTAGMIDDSSDTRVFFCVKTQECLGPDHEPVSPDDCTRNRTCYCTAASSPDSPTNIESGDPSA